MLKNNPLLDSLDVDMSENGPCKMHQNPSHPCHINSPPYGSAGGCGEAAPPGPVEVVLIPVRVHDVLCLVELNLSNYLTLGKL